MKDYMRLRVLEIADFVKDSKSTVRKAASEFGVSKSTVHKDLTERLYLINPQLFEEIRKILDHNKSERHIRGGKATRLKYQTKN